ncbi:ROK family protein [Methylorubrum podarium]|uniref:ROK family protein n=1 Tax=Methylorubrum podarium TaxID=200476 RepID=A0ABV1QJZ7_9HYPH
MACQHGSGRLAGFRIDGYNLKLEENGGFVGDRVRSRAFAAVLDGLRRSACDAGPDPLGSVASDDRPALDKILEQEGTAAARLIGQAVERYATEFAEVVRRFLATREWAGIEAVAVGGGLRGSRLGERAIRRAEALLEAGGHPVRVRPIQVDPDEAALLGAVHLRPADVPGHEAILAVDIGGGNVRAGVVRPGRGGSRAAEVLLREHWRHRHERVDRDEMVTRLTTMLASLVHRARHEGLSVAPFVGIGCPGAIRADGAITCGTQNLPGNWQEAGFNLPARVAASLSSIDDDEVRVILHNDAVLQGLGEASRMCGYVRWGVLTIGTGLGNATFTSLTSVSLSEEPSGERPLAHAGSA